MSLDHIDQSKKTDTISLSFKTPASSFVGNEVDLLAHFSDRTYLEAGGGSWLSLCVETTKGDRRAGASLGLNVRVLNDPVLEHELAEKIREFVRDLKALHEFSQSDPDSAVPTV